eukprot:m.225535 g.225535  ORF g.225535 m.225535 type:complete len:86 (-) comp15958_c0_seq1:3115-3372(-)
MVRRHREKELNPRVKLLFLYCFSSDFFFKIKKKTTQFQKHLNNSLFSVKKMKSYQSFEFVFMTLRQTCSQDGPEAQFAFKDSMIH